jgi:hypothetical protein
MTYDGITDTEWRLSTARSPLTSGSVAKFDFRLRLSDGNFADARKQASSVETQAQHYILKTTFATALSRRADVILMRCQPIRIAVTDFRRRSSLNAYGCTSTFP